MRLPLATLKGILLYRSVQKINCQYIYVPFTIDFLGVFSFSSWLVHFFFFGILFLSNAMLSSFRNGLRCPRGGGGGGGALQ